MKIQPTLVRAAGRRRGVKRSGRLLQPLREHKLREDCEERDRVREKEWRPALGSPNPTPVLLLNEVVVARSGSPVAIHCSPRWGSAPFGRFRQASHALSRTRWGYTKGEIAED